MDKETLSNYGWIVVAVMVLVVMIALATPFGKFVSQAVQSTTKGLFSTSQNALNSAGVPGLTIEDQEFNVPSAETENVVVGSATFNKQPVEGCSCMEIYGAHLCLVSIEPITLTWEELRDPANGQKYGYNASAITDTAIDYAALSLCEALASIVIPDNITAIGTSAFVGCTYLNSIRIPDSVTTIGAWALSDCATIESIVIPDSITTIGEHAFSYCDVLTNIKFEGTTAQWNAISFGNYWHFDCPEITVTCKDGTITIPADK